MRKATFKRKHYGYGYAADMGIRHARIEPRGSAGRGRRVGIVGGGPYAGGGAYYA